jgi:hypothetical protein
MLELFMGAMLELLQLFIIIFKIFFQIFDFNFLGKIHYLHFPQGVGILNHMH